MHVQSVHAVFYMLWTWGSCSSYDKLVKCVVEESNFITVREIPFLCQYEVRGQPRFETGSIYHFMLVEKGVWHPGSRPAGIYGLSNSWGNIPMEYNILLVMPQSHPTTGPIQFLSPVRFLARKAEWSARSCKNGMVFGMHTPLDMKMFSVLIGCVC